MQFGERAVGLDPEQCAVAEVARIGIETGAAVPGRAVQRAIRPGHERCLWTRAIGAAEIMQLGEGAVRLQSEQRAVAAVGTGTGIEVETAVIGRAVQRAIRPRHQRCLWIDAVGAAELMQLGKGAVRLQSEQRTVAARGDGTGIEVDAAVIGRAVQRAIWPGHERRLRTRAIGDVELMQLGKGAVGL